MNTLASNRTVAEVDLNAITGNFEKLKRIAIREGAGRMLTPMLKCNAYGHGLLPVGRALEKMPGVAAMGLAGPDEARRLREGGISVPLWVFSESESWSPELEGLYEAQGLVPVLHDVNDIRAALKSKRKIPFQIKINTGMNRLGIEPDELKKLLPLLKKARGRWMGVCTHLAEAEEPRGAISRAQAACFRDLIASIGDLPPFVHALATRGIAECRRLGLSGICNVARPGIGLYGYGAPRANLVPALTWKAKVIKVRKLQAGKCVGYAGTFITQGKETAAVLSAGYGDGIKRGLSNRVISGRRVLGRISMDLTSIDGRGLKRGQWVTLLDRNPELGESMSAEAQTIIYEILTGISDRVPRVYRGGQMRRRGKA